MDPQAPGYAGFKDYTPGFLRIYDWWVMGVMARAVWRTPVQPMVDAHTQHVGRRHLDVGPGTGYLLDAAELPSDVTLTLLDPNPHVLAYAATRLGDHEVVTVEANVLEPLPVEGPFDSAGLSNVLHCLPGPMEAKAAAVRHIAEVLAPDGILVGSTVLGLGAAHGRAARSFIRLANRRRAFDNADDSVEGLQAILERSFTDVSIDVEGSLALFVARGPEISA